MACPGESTAPAAERAPEAGSSLPVLLPLPLGGSYSYLPWPRDGGGEPELAPGDLVAVPLGRRETWGVVWDHEIGADGGPSAAAAPAPA
ncbi:MAG: hypothetical protein WD100_13845, partial [Tistlia sp.]